MHYNSFFLDPPLSIDLKKYYVNGNIVGVWFQILLTYENSLKPVTCPYRLPIHSRAIYTNNKAVTAVSPQRNCCVPSWGVRIPLFLTCTKNTKQNDQLCTITHINFKSQMSRADVNVAPSIEGQNTVNFPRICVQLWLQL